VLTHKAPVFHCQFGAGGESSLPPLETGKALWKPV